MIEKDKKGKGYVKQPATYDAESSILTLTAAFTMIFALGLFSLHLFDFPLNAEILDCHVRRLNLESTRAQVMFYLTLLGLFAAICGAALIWPNAKMMPNITRVHPLLLIVVVVVAIFLGSWSKRFLLGFSFFALLIFFSRTHWFDQLIAARMESRIPLFQLFTGRGFWLLTVSIYIIFFLILPLATPFPIQDGAQLRAMEGHYAVTVIPGFDFLCCSEVGTIERANYGLGMPLFTALSLKLFSLFGLPDTVLVRVVMLSQVVAVAMICVLSFLVNRKYCLYVMALALGMTTFILSNVGPVLVFPNLTGIRYIPILVSLILLVLEMRREHWRVWLLASASAVLVIMSPETGLATTAGFIVALLLKRYDTRMPIISLSKTLVIFMVTFMVTGMAGSALLIDPILKNGSGGLFQFLALFIKDGYGGMVDKPSLVASLLFFVAATKVLQSVWRTRNGFVTSLDAYEAAIGTIMLVWMIYYINRMAESNLWFQFVLLTLLIAPRVTHDFWRYLLQKPLKNWAMFAMVMACLIGGQLIGSSAYLAWITGKWAKCQYTKCGDSVVLDGKYLPWFPGSQFELQMNALKEKYSPTNTIVLTGFSTYARLRGFNDGFPLYSPGEVVLRKDIDELVNWIEMHGTQYILADDPAYDIGSTAPEHCLLIQSYLPKLASYQEVRRDDGWIVLERFVKSAR